MPEAVMVRPPGADVQTPKLRIHPNPAASVTTSAPEEAQANASGQASTAQTETAQPNDAAASESDAAQAPQVAQEATTDQSAPKAPTQDNAVVSGITADDKIDSQATPEGESLAPQGDREKVQVVVNQIVDRRINGARERYNKLKASNPAAAQALIAKGSATKAMLELGILRDGEQADYIDPLEVVLDGETIKVLGIIGRSGENLNCRVAGEQGAINRSIPVDVAVNAKLKGDEAILADFPPGHPQREALEFHIKALRGEDIAADSEQTTKVVQEARANLDGAEWESPIAKMLKERIGAVEIEMKARAGRGEGVEGYQRVLIMLQTAQHDARGDLGIIFQGRALQAAGMDTAVLAAAIPGYSQQVAQAREIMMETMHLTDEETAALNAAGDNVERAAKIIEGALLKSNNGKAIEQLVFGRELEEGELAKLLGIDPKKSEGNAGLLWLIVFLIQETTKSLVGKQGG